MKLNVIYEQIFSLRKKLSDRNQREFTREETALMIAILDAIEGDYYPSQEEYDRQINRLKQLDHLDYDKQRETWDRVMAQCTEFENKFC